MRHLISPAPVEYTLRTLIPTNKHLGPLALLPLTRVEGEAQIGILSVDPARPRRGLADRELAFQVRLRIAPSVHITALGVQEQWRLEIVVTLQLRVHVQTEPLSLQIDLDEVTTRAIRVRESKCIEGADCSK